MGSKILIDTNIAIGYIGNQYYYSMNGIFSTKYIPNDLYYSEIHELI